MASLLVAPLVVVVGAAAFGTQSFSLVPLGVALLVGILPNPCTAGVQAVEHEIAAGEMVTVHDHWSGLRLYARPAAVAWLVSFAVTAVIVGNAAFYLHIAASSSGLLRLLAPPLLLAWLLVFVVWMSMHLYIFPLLIQQETKSLRLVYRNAALMTIARPSTTMVIMLIWVLLLLLSSITGLVTFIGLALSASIQQNATARLLPTFKLRGPDHE